jgi:hypothetical protein
VRQQTEKTACIGLFIYNAGAGGLMILFGVLGEQNGNLLWPAAGFHGFIGIAMLAAILRRIRSDYICPGK